LSSNSKTSKWLDAPHYGYGWYTQEQLEDYYNQLIGDYAKTLEQETFTDAEKTNYLEAIKYVANLVWNEYQTKQHQSGPLVNVDVLDTILLSLHPMDKLKDLSLSDYTREGLAEMQQFQDLIHLETHKGHDGYGHRNQGPTGGHHHDMPAWLQNIPDNYTAQLAIMGWFLTLTSKMTGYTIPGVGVAPGGTIEKPRGAVDHFLKDMETLADAMAVQKNWDRPQYAILKEMYLDLKRMHYSFRVNRDQTTGKFRPMSEVDGPKFPAERSNRRDFPDTKEEFEEEKAKDEGN